MKRVILAPGGIFHSPLLIRILNNINFNISLFSAYPKSYFNHYMNFDIKHHFIPMPFQSFSKIFKIKLKFEEVDSFIFEYLLSKKIIESEYFHGWAGFSNLSMKKLAKQNTKIKMFLERSCPHIEHQENLMRDEHKFLKIEYKEKSLKFYDKCKEEYDICDQIVVPSKYTAETFYSKGFDKKKIYISSLSYKFNKYEILNEHINKTKKFKVCSVGGNVTRKGFYYLIKAWNELNIKNAELNLRTDINELKKIKKIADLLNESNSINIIDKIDNIKSFYLDHDLFCLTSIDEGFGMVVTEALNCGLPIIISENVGAKDLFEDYKSTEPQIFKITKIRDVEEIKNAIKYYFELYNTNRYPELNEANKNFINSRLNSESNIYEKNIISLYE